MNDLAFPIEFHLNFASDLSTEGVKQGFRQGGKPIFAQAWQRYFEHKMGAANAVERLDLTAECRNIRRI